MALSIDAKTHLEAAAASHARIARINEANVSKKEADEECTAEIQVVDDKNPPQWALDELKRQEREAKLLSKFLTTEYFRCDKSENAAKLAQINILLMEDVDINAEDAVGQTMLDYAITAGNFFLALELIILGANKCKNINQLNAAGQNLISHTLENKPGYMALLITLGAKINSANWDAIIKIGQDSAVHVQDSAAHAVVKKNNKYQLRLNAALLFIKKTMKLDLLDRTHAWIQLTDKVMKILGKITTEFNIHESKFKGELEAQLKKYGDGFFPKVASETVLRLKTNNISETREMLIKTVYDILRIFENVNNILVLRIEREKQAPHIISQLACNNRVCLAILEADFTLKELEQNTTNRFAKLSTAGWRPHMKVAYEGLQNFLSSYYREAKQTITQIKKIIRPATRDFYQDVLGFCRGAGSEPVRISNPAIKRFMSFIEKMIDIHMIELKAFVQREVEGVSSSKDILDFLEIYMRNKKQELIDLCNLERRSDEDIRGQQEFFSDLHGIKMVIEVTFHAVKAKFILLIDMARELSEPNNRLMQSEVSIQELCDHIGDSQDHSAVVAADRKRLKELEQHKKEERRVLLLQEEMQKQKEKEAQEQKNEADRKAKEMHATLMTAVKQLGKPQLQTLLSILKHGHHSDISDKDLIALFGLSDNNLAEKHPLFPFSLKKTAKGFQVCFNQIPIDAHDRQHGGKANSEALFNSIRKKFEDVGITAGYIEKCCSATSGFKVK